MGSCQPDLRYICNICNDIWFCICCDKVLLSYERVKWHLMHQHHDIYADNYKYLICRQSSFLECTNLDIPVWRNTSSDTHTNSDTSAFNPCIVQHKRNDTDTTIPAQQEHAEAEIGCLLDPIVEDEIYKDTLTNPTISLQMKISTVNCSVVVPHQYTIDSDRERFIGSQIHTGNSDRCNFSLKNYRSGFLGSYDQVNLIPYTDIALVTTSKPTLCIERSKTITVVKNDRDVGCKKPASIVRGKSDASKLHNINKLVKNPKNSIAVTDLMLTIQEDNNVLPLTLTSQEVSAIQSRVLNQIGDAKRIDSTTKLWIVTSQAIPYTFIDNKDKTQECKCICCEQMIQVNQIRFHCKKHEHKKRVFQKLVSQLIPKQLTMDFSSNIFTDTTGTPYADDIYSQLLQLLDELLLAKYMKWNIICGDVTYYFELIFLESNTVITSGLFESLKYARHTMNKKILGLLLANQIVTPETIAWLITSICKCKLYTHGTLADNIMHTLNTIDPNIRCIPATAAIEGMKDPLKKGNASDSQRSQQIHKRRGSARNNSKN